MTVRRAVVTGASSGIGAATARTLAAVGFEVICAARRLDRVQAVADEIGAGRVGLRISPGNGAGDMRELDTVGAYEALLTRIAPLNIAYLHVLVDPSTPEFGVIRGHWLGTLVLNTGREVDTSFCQLEELAEWGVIGAAAVGRRCPGPGRQGR